MRQEPSARIWVLSPCFGSTDACLRSGTRAERPADRLRLMARIIGGSMESPDRRKLAGAFPRFWRNAASPTGLCTDSPTYLSPRRQDSSGTTVSLSYCCHVLQILRE